jgi:NAD(P)-dependent dehydrogenase (short-subunit alcohol dehydrogenase family)
MAEATSAVRCAVVRSLGRWTESWDDLVAKAAVRRPSPGLGGSPPLPARTPSKLFVTTLMAAVAAQRSATLSNAVDPGWVPTRMGGPGAPDDLRLGHLTQEWLATSDDAEARTSGGYWHHQRRRQPHRPVHDPRFQQELLDDLVQFTGISLG